MYRTYKANLLKKYKANSDIVSSFRIFNTRTMILFYMLGLKLGKVQVLSFDLLRVFIVFILSYASASVLNYFSDRKIDIENRKFNPLNLKNSDIQLYRAIAIGCMFLSLIFSISTKNPAITSTGALLIIFLGYAYSSPPLLLSHNPLGKIVCLGIVYYYLPAIMGILSGEIVFASLLILLLLASVHFAWIPFSDVRDIPGDKANRKTTIAVLFGEKTTIYLSLILSGIFMVFTLLANLITKSIPYHSVIVLFVLLIWQTILAFRPVNLRMSAILNIGRYLLLLQLILYILF